MPTWDRVLEEVDRLNPLEYLKNKITDLHNTTHRTTIIYMSAFSVIKPPVPSPFHAIIDQDIQGFMTCVQGTDKNALDLIIHTPGGDYEATKRIINYLHSTYEHIRVIIPHLAMSGGTLIACAADEIVMGPYSSLGPTDPQFLLKEGYVPVQAIIDEFNLAFEEVSSEPSKALLWNERLKQIPFGKFKAAIIMQKNSFKYLMDILKKRNCRCKSPQEIEEIANFLNRHEQHSSHGQGIFLSDLVGKLNVSDLHTDKVFEDKVLSIYHTATILFQRTSAQKIIISHLGRTHVNNYNPS